MLRRVRVVSFVLLVLLAAAASGASANQTRVIDRQRALATYAAMQRFFYTPKSASYAGAFPAAGRAQAWPYSQALWATVAVARLPGVGGGFDGDLVTRVEALAAYRHSEPGGVAYAPVYGGGGEVYYDDNLWIALALVEATGVTNDPSSLGTARHLFSLVTDGWDANQADPCPGGVFWKRTGANHDRNTVTTANSALLALTLNESSARPSYVLWAERAYGWAKACLGTGSGLVADHIDLAGTIDPRTWSYNQGAMIATAVRLYHLTGQRHYLDEAEQDADATLAKLGDPLASGEPAVFLAIFYRDLLELSAADPTRHDRAAVATFADEAWAKARDPKTGIFHFDHDIGTLLDQAAMVQIYALLSN